MDCRDIGYYDRFYKGSDDNIYIVSAFADGNIVCTCPDFQYRKRYCKHIKRFLKKVNMSYNIEHEMEKYPTSLDVIEDLFNDKPYNSDEIVSIYGKSRIGKSILAVQEACHLASNGYNVLYIDTEGSAGIMFDKWEEVFETRFGEGDGHIEIVTKKHHQPLLKYLGWDAALVPPKRSKGKKKKSGKFDFEYYGKYKKPQIDKDIKDNDIDFVVLDSMTAPLRDCPATRQNFPARSDLASTILRSIISKMDEYKLGVMAAHHTCHDEKTKTISKDKGIVNYKEIKKGDKVLGIDKEGNTVWTDVEDKFVYDYDGEMIHLKGKSSDQLVTPNHRVMVSPKHLKYRMHKDNLIDDGKYILAKNITKNGIQVPRASLDVFNPLDLEEVINSNPLEYIVGWYIAEGDKYIDERYDDSKRVRFSVHIEDVKPITKALDELGLGYHIYDTERSPLVRYITMYGDDARKLWESIKECGNKAPKKNIPEEVLDSTDKPSQYALLLGYLMGDGHKAGKNRWMFTTTSKQLVEDLTEISTKLGYAITFRLDENVSGFGNEDSDAYSGTIRFTNKSWVCPNEVDYKGKIWSLQTGTTNYAIVKNNKVTFSGNSFDPADFYKSVKSFNMVGGMIVQHFSKRIIFIDRREHQGKVKKSVKEYRRLWLARSEDEEEFSKAAVAKITDTGYQDVTKKKQRKATFTSTEQKMVGLK